MSLPVEFSSGDLGEAVAFDGKILSLISPGAFAPGMPLGFRVDARGEALELNGKSIGSRRRADGRFDVRVRLVSLRREQRETLESLLEG